VRDRLTAALAPFKNRDAAFALAVFLARFWSVPGRVAGSFPIDRRALADHMGLELTEARVRGAIKALEAVGYLDRALAPSGSKYRATETGLHRKAVLYVFGAEYGPAFIAANKRAHAARGGLVGARRLIPSPIQRSPSAAILEARLTNSPKSKSEAESKVFMGEIRKGNGLPAEPSVPTTLDLALLRLGEGVFGKPRVGSDGAKRDSEVRQKPCRSGTLILE
jgi:hypothetical protein